MQNNCNALSQNSNLPQAFYNTNSRPVHNFRHGNLDMQQKGAICLPFVTSPGPVHYPNTEPAYSDHNNSEVSNPVYIHWKNESYCIDTMVNEKGMLLKKKLGKGGCGIVFAATRMSDYASAAIKYLSKYNVTYLETGQGRSVPR